MPGHIPISATPERSLVRKAALPKPPVTLFSSLLGASALLFFEPSVTVLAAAGSLQLVALAVYRLTQLLLQWRSHSSVRALVCTLRDNDADLTVTLGANGELQVVKVAQRRHITHGTQATQHVVAGPS